MKKHNLTIILLGLAISLFATGGGIVHDPIAQASRQAWQAVEKAWQKTNLENQFQQIMTAKDIFEVGERTFEMTENVFEQTEKIYNTGVTLYNYMGDPAGLASYLNRKTVNSKMLNFSIDKINSAINDEFAFNSLRDLYGYLGDGKYAVTSAKDDKNSLTEWWKSLDKTEAKAAASMEVTEESLEYLRDAVEENNEMANSFNSDAEKNVNKSSYLNYQTNQNTYDLLSKWMAADIAHSQSVDQYIANENNKTRMASKYMELQEQSLTEAEENIQNGNLQEIQKQRRDMILETE